MFGIISVLLLKHFIAVLWCWCPINTILMISRHLFKFRETDRHEKIRIILYRIYSIVGITSEAFIFNTKKSNLKKKQKTTRHKNVNGWVKRTSRRFKSEHFVPYEPGGLCGEAERVTTVEIRVQKIVLI